MSMQMQERIAVTTYVVPFVFQASNIPDAAGTANTIEATTPHYVMPFAGSVIAISVRHNADLTGGVITWNPTIDGTANTSLGCVTDDTNQQRSARVGAGVVRFTANQRLGVAWTETGTVAPTTTDVSIVVLVAFDDVNLVP